MRKTSHGARDDISPMTEIFDAKWLHEQKNTTANAATALVDARSSDLRPFSVAI